MKCVLLAGGLGTRISEETQVKPKPMVEIGGRPILWHIMKIYSSFGINDFIVCLGYKGYMIKEYFANYYLHRSDATIDLARNSIEYHDARSEPWRITLVDTGDSTMTGGRLRRVRSYLTPGETFCMTYGDGLADVDVRAQLDFHAGHGRKATMTLVRPQARFGAVEMDGHRVTSFKEKPQSSEGLINGGFFVLDPSVIDEVDGDATSWELEPLNRLVAQGELMGWQHDGFWQPMDTLREKMQLEALWSSGKAPWRLWS